MEKTALVLGGGGSRGSYQVGVWQALKELDVEIDIVTGTSVGALNAALVTIDDLEKATNMWKSLKTDMILSVNVDDSLPLDKKIISTVKQFFIDYVKKGGTDSYPLKQLIDRVVDEKLMRESKIHCGLIAVDKRTFKPLEVFVDEIEEGLVSDYLLASSSLFPAMQSYKIGEIDYIDGGYYDNLPVSLALKRGATKIIAVDLEAIGIKHKDVLRKTADLILIKSYWDLGPILVFDTDTIFRNIRLGYLDTMKKFDVFDGMAYTFVKNSIGKYVRKNKEFFKQYNSIVNIKHNALTKTNREYIFYNKLEKHIKSKYGTAIGKKFNLFFLACMETAGEIFLVDPKKIYSYDSFSKSVFTKVNAQEIPLLRPLKELTLKATFNLLDKKTRTIYLAYNIRNALLLNETLDKLYYVIFLPDEFLAAYYLALLD